MVIFISPLKENTAKRSYISVPHLGGHITFAYPEKYSTNYDDLQRRILNDTLDSLVPPTASETVSLLCETSNEYRDSLDRNMSLRPDYGRIMNILLKSLGFLTFTGNLFISKDDKELSNGVFIQDLPKIDDKGIYMDRNTLEKAFDSESFNEDGVLWSRNRDSRFVPFGYEFGISDPSKLVSNSYIIALLRGKEQAEKLRRISEALGVITTINIPSGELLNRHAVGGVYLEYWDITWGENSKLRLCFNDNLLIGGYALGKLNSSSHEKENIKQSI
ncbi:hypothetical protein HYW75_03025 [Candidatus Pacearchaeota archaeon]|nr:hypothetical protein [Candidatus Pacearchaeota archaeon]